MLAKIFKTRPKVTDISVAEFDLMMTKYILLAQCCKDPIDVQAKEYLFAVIQSRGIPAPDAYEPEYEVESVTELGTIAEPELIDYDDPNNIIIHRADGPHRYPHSGRK